MNERVRLKIKEIAANQLECSLTAVGDNAAFMDDLGADSLDVTEMIMTMEEAFGLEIPDEDAEKIVTVSDAVGYVTNKLNRESVSEHE